MRKAEGRATRCESQGASLNCILACLECSQLPIQDFIPCEIEENTKFSEIRQTIAASDVEVGVNDYQSPLYHDNSGGLRFTMAHMVLTKLSRLGISRLDLVDTSHLLLIQIYALDQAAHSDPQL